MIDVSKWGEFIIGDLFDVVKGSRLTKANKKAGDINFVSTSIYNNGVINKIGNTEHIHPENTIVVVYDGHATGRAYYQDEPYWASDSVNVLYPKFKLNQHIALFLIPVLESVGKKFVYTNKWTQEKMQKTSFLLPVDSKGQPHWDYMESYMKQVMEESEQNFNNLQKANNSKHIIDVSGWAEFRVGDLFDKLTLKCRKEDFNKAIDCSEEQTEEFSLPLTNAKHFNNGIQFYGRPDEWDSAEMTIDIVSNGAVSTGDVFAQPQKTGVLWDSYLVKCKYDITSELVLQYMACVIQRCIKQYFGWDDKCTWNKVKEQMIKLPITKTGELDWQYMERYMKEIMDKSEKLITDLSTGLL